VANLVHNRVSSSHLHPFQRPKFGELLSTVKFTVQTLAAAGELQRDLQRELTYDGLLAAEAENSKGARRPAVASTRTGSAPNGAAHQLDRACDKNLADPETSTRHSTTIAHPVSLPLPHTSAVANVSNS
jgi:hypothetical protein